MIVALLHLADSSDGEPDVIVPIDQHTAKEILDIAFIGSQDATEINIWVIKITNEWIGFVEAWEWLATDV